MVPTLYPAKLDRVGVLPHLGVLPHPVDTYILNIISNILYKIHCNLSSVFRYACCNKDVCIFSSLTVSDTYQKTYENVSREYMEVLNKVTGASTIIFVRVIKE